MSTYVHVGDHSGPEADDHDPFGDYLPREYLSGVGEFVRVLLVTSHWIVGEIVQVYSGQGTTDGLLHIRQADGLVYNVYERHIVMLYKEATGTDV